jgi:hypothetical protein
MIRVWTSSLRVTTREVSLLVQDDDVGDVIKARLPLAPRHPRALLTLLEGVALWRGQPLRVVLSASGPSVPWLGSDLFGDEMWPGESPLVTFSVAHPGRRRRLEGLGDFRPLRRVARGEP